MTKKHRAQQLVAAETSGSQCLAGLDVRLARDGCSIRCPQHELHNLLLVVAN